MHYRALVVLVFGVACLSTAAVLIRLADAPPLATAAWRLTLTSVVLAPLALATSRGDLRHLKFAELRWVLLAGGMLALHFALWITSLGLTSVASSVVLVTTNPLWVALAAPFVLHERPGRNLWLGIAVAFVGAAIIGWGDVAAGSSVALGDILAIGGAIAAASYFLLGRRMRGQLRLVPYVALVYGTAAVILLGAAILARQPLTGYPRATWLCFVGLAVVPQLLGHSSFNWALRHLSATMVAGAVLGEALGSTLLAWQVLSEPPPRLTVVGGSLVLAGLALAAWAESRAKDNGARGGAPALTEGQPRLTESIGAGPTI
jgi:drug/metabolite transporter (DMT)-like permease